MPVYEYTCKSCGQYFTRYLSLTRYRDPQTCECGAVAEKLISAPAVRGDYEAYNCPITGKRIEGRKAHEENLRRHGCRVLEPGEVGSATSRRARETAELEDAVAESAAQAVATLPRQKREKLEAELSQGLDVQVTRT